MEGSSKKVKVAFDIVEQALNTLPEEPKQNEQKKTFKKRLKEYSEQETIIRPIIVNVLKHCDVYTMCALVDASLRLRNYMEQQNRWKYFAENYVEEFKILNDNDNTWLQPIVEFSKEKINYFWLILAMRQWKNLKNITKFTLDGKKFCKIDFRSKVHKISRKNRDSDNSEYKYIITPCYPYDNNDKDKYYVTNFNPSFVDQDDYDSDDNDYIYEMKSNKAFMQVVKNVKRITKTEYYYEGFLFPFVGFKECVDYAKLYILYAVLSVRNVKLVIKQKTKVSKSKKVTNTVEIRTQFYI